MTAGEEDPVAAAAAANGDAAEQPAAATTAKTGTTAGATVKTTAGTSAAPPPPKTTAAGAPAAAPEPAEAEAEANGEAEAGGGSNDADGAAEADTDEADAAVDDAADAVVADAAVADEKPKRPKKPIKKSIPKWATFSDVEKQKMAKKNKVEIETDRPRMESVIVEALKDCADDKGVAFALRMKKAVQKSHPTWPKPLFKKALQKAVNTSLIKQVKGKSLTMGYFKLLPAKAGGAASSRSSGGAKLTSAQFNANVGIDDILPYVITWCSDPKEASVGLILKYVEKHAPDVFDKKKLLKALETLEKRGCLARLTGKGASGTYQLVDGATKIGIKFENAIEDAIIAMNEPKDCSVIALRKYFAEYNLEFKVDQRPKKLRAALDRCEARGWIKRISGKGFSGKFRLAYPYQPSPRQLWREEYDDKDYRAAAAAAGKEPPTATTHTHALARKKAKPSEPRGKYYEGSSDEQSEDDDEMSAEATSSSAEEFLPAKKHRGGGAPAAAPRGGAKRAAPTTTAASKQSVPSAKRKKLAPQVKKKTTTGKASSAASARGRYYEGSSEEESISEEDDSPDYRPGRKAPAKRSPAKKAVVAKARKVTVAAAKRPAPKAKKATATPAKARAAKPKGRGRPPGKKAAIVITF